MALTFPTMAEKCLTAWRDYPGTIGLPVIDRRHGADCAKASNFEGVVWTYTFDDDTSLVVRGKGKSHKIEMCFP